MSLFCLFLPDRMHRHAVKAVLGLVASGSLAYGLGMAADFANEPAVPGHDPFPWLLGGAGALILTVFAWAAGPLIHAARLLPGRGMEGAPGAAAGLHREPVPAVVAPQPAPGSTPQWVRAPGETSLRSYKVALDDAPAAIVITDAAARIEYVNDAFLAYSGYSREELIGQNPRIFSSGRTSEAVYRSLWQALSAGEKWKGNLYNRRKSGVEFWEQMAISPLRDEFGRVSHFIAVRQDITESKRREDELQRLARIDPLTGVNNRRRLMELATREWQRAERLGQSLGLLMIDIDHFKRINDVHGHPVGDRAICIVAHACVEMVREIDVVGRYGGEEFVVLLPATDVEGARGAAERLRLRIASLRIDTGVDGAAPLALSASIGVAALHAGETLEQLLALADAALYRAKNMGRNRTVAATDGPENE